jgi:hypothetical protein
MKRTSRREDMMQIRLGVNRAIGALALSLVASGASAAFHAFVIDELYSSPDGSVQFIELRESFGANGENLLAGHTLTSTSVGTTRIYTFPSNLPSNLTANKHVLIATQGFADLGIVVPDYIVPSPFLFPGGGTLNYAGVDSLTYPALPGDGVSALYRNGTVAPNVATNFVGQTGSILPPPPPPPPPPPTPVADVPTLAPPPLAVLVALLVLGAVWVRRSRR